MKKERIWIALFLVLVLALILRTASFPTNAFGEPDTYFHMRMTEQFIQEKGVPYYDELSLQGRFYHYATFFHAMNASFSILSGLKPFYSVRILPVIFGLIGVLLAFVFARKIFKDDKIALFAAFFLATMIFHMFRSSGDARPDGLALLLVAAIIYLVYSKRFLAAAFLGSAQILLHPLSSMYLILFLIVWAFVFKFKRKEFSFIKVFLIIELMVLIFLLWLMNSPYPISLYVSAVSMESSEMQKPLMLEFFYFFNIAWIFLMIGLVNIRKYFFLVLWFVFSFLYVMVGVRLGLFVAFPVAIISALGFHWIEGKVKEYKKILYVLLLILSAMTLFYWAQPGGGLLNQKEVASLNWMKEFTAKDANIMSIWDRGHPITYYTQRKVVIDGYFEFAPRLEERNNSMKTLISTSDCRKIAKETKKFNINYFFAPNSALGSIDFLNGILEAKNCANVESVFDNGGSRIIKYTK